MANVKYNENTYYVPNDKFLIAVLDHATIHKDPSNTSKMMVCAKVGQVYSVSSVVNDMYRIKPGWISKEFCEVLVAATNEVITLEYPFVVKVISNIPVLTEASPDAHATTVLRPGDLRRVIGESEDFYQLETGDFITKRGCRRY
ncbi:hypothetical protein [Turicibacter sanguinis]|uniref:hypothetical protein n=1 Tax=Turicibacter sanguinis TaxID=154288 RepID=UPI0032ED099D